MNPTLCPVDLAPAEARDLERVAMALGGRVRPRVGARGIDTFIVPPSIDADAVRVLLATAPTALVLTPAYLAASEAEGSWLRDPTPFIPEAARGVAVPRDVGPRSLDADALPLVGAAADTVEDPEAGWRNRRARDLLLRKSRSSGAVDDAGGPSSPSTAHSSSSSSLSSSSTTPDLVRTLRKGRAALDPFLPAELVQRVHVYESPSEAYSCMLNQTNLRLNNNKFYAMQLLEDDADRSKHWIWFRWGRVGKNGQTSLDPYDSLGAAIAAFEAKFEAKTGHVWSDRHAIVPVEGRYTMIHLATDEREGGHEDEDEDEGEGKGGERGDGVKAEDKDREGDGAGGGRGSRGRRRSSASVGAYDPFAVETRLAPERLDDEDGDDDDDRGADGAVRSHLPLPVQALLRLISSPSMFRRTVEEIGFDPTQLPLGRISDATIAAGARVLATIRRVVRGEERGDLLSLSGSFYTLIPHDFGFQPMRLFVIRTLAKVAEKEQLLESLQDIVIARRVLQRAAASVAAAKAAAAAVAATTSSSSTSSPSSSSSSSSSLATVPHLLHPLDAQYAAMECRLRVLTDHEPADRATLATLRTAVRQTHAPTHVGFTITVEDVFEVFRPAEAQAWHSAPRGGARVGGSRLLWHGSRLGNWLGILAQGLRVAPPEAPTTGFMFGRGVYFADVASKAANYAFPSVDNPVGLLVLAEVALGDGAPWEASDVERDSEPANERENDEADRKLPADCVAILGLGQNRPDPRGDTVLRLDDWPAWAEPAREAPSSHRREVPLSAGRIVPSEDKRPCSLLYNEFVVYDPAQVRIRFALRLRFNFGERPGEEEGSEI